MIRSKSPIMLLADDAAAMLLAACGSVALPRPM
jgi:hypothetical protein